MRSTFYGLEIARSGLYTSQNELNVTGHNISNVDTVGYSRQRLNTAALPPISMNVQFAVDNRATSGRGVEALTVDQVRDLFLDAKYREEAHQTGYWNTKMNEFEMVQQLYNSVLESSNTSANIYNAIGSFQNALSDLHETPSSISLRKNVLTKAGQLAETFNYIYDKLQTQHSDLNSSIEVTVGQINDISQSIANLNRQIFGYELSGAKANDLRDSRNLLLDQLSGMVDIQYYENSQGYLTVTIGGRELVNGVAYNLLAVDPQGAVNQMDVVSNADVIGRQSTVVWADGLGRPSKNPDDVVRLGGGSLKAYIDLRDGATAENVGVPYAAAKLNELARQIAKEVNDIHRQGWTMPFLEEDALGTAQDVRVYNEHGAVTLGLTPGTVTGPNGDKTYYQSTQGINFFEVGEANDYSKINAGNFCVSAEIEKNVYLIACSSERMTVAGELNADNTLNMQTGNNENILKLMALADRKNELGNADNYQDRLKALVSDVGTRHGHLKSMDSAQQVRIYSIVQQRASVSSVSLDEEMTNVVRFTHAYNANARVLTAIDEELDTLINKMGLVGR